MITHVISWGIRMCQKNCAPPIFCSYVTNFREITDVHQCNTQPITYSQCISQPVRICLRWRSKTEGEQILVISAMKHRTSGDVDHETLTFTEFNNEKQHFLTTVFLYIIHTYTYVYIYIGGHIHLVINFCLSGPLPRHAAPCALVKKTSRAEGLETPSEMARYWWSIPTILIGQIYENHPIFPETWGK